MNLYFGSPEEHESSTSSTFWLGIDGLIALPICIIMILCGSFIHHPPNKGKSLAEVADFGSKLMGNQLSIALFIGDTELLYFKFYTATEV